MKKSRCQNPVNIPQARGAIMRGREKTVVGRAELHMFHQGAMAAEGGKQRRVLDVPNADRAVQGSRC